MSQQRSEDVCLRPTRAWRSGILPGASPEGNRRSTRYVTTTVCIFIWPTAVEGRAWMGARAFKAAGRLL